MEDIKKYFDMLGLHIDASLDEVKQSYRDQINVWHPDRFQNNLRLQTKATEKLKEINEAYTYICDYIALPKRNSIPKENNVREENIDATSSKKNSEEPPIYYSNTRNKYKTSGLKREVLQGVSDYLNRPFWQTVLFVIMVVVVKLISSSQHAPKESVKAYQSEVAPYYYNATNTQPQQSPQVNTHYNPSQVTNNQQSGGYYNSQQETNSNKDNTSAKIEDEQNDSEALFKLGRKYYRGDGVPKNETKSIAYYKKAAKLGHVESVEFLKVLGISSY